MAIYDTLEVHLAVGLKQMKSREDLDVLMSGQSLSEKKSMITIASISEATTGHESVQWLIR